MGDIRKQLLDRFEEHLNINFECHCERHKIEKNAQQFLSFLIDQGLITGTEIQRYAVLKEFEARNSGQAQQKTQTVNQLAGLFRISERTIWNILRQIKRT
jgi:hypothetical protein